MSQKDLILRLIRDDLIHYRLVSGLSDLNLLPDHYHLYLGETVMSLVGFTEGSYYDLVYERIYMPMTEQVTAIDLMSPALDHLASGIYTALMDAREVEAAMCKVV